MVPIDLRMRSKNRAMSVACICSANGPEIAIQMGTFFKALPREGTGGVVAISITRLQP